MLIEFLLSLEAYFWKTTKRVPYPVAGIGTGIVGAALLATVIYSKQQTPPLTAGSSPYSPPFLAQAIATAGSTGDYPLARALHQWLEAVDKGTAQSMRVAAYPEEPILEDIERLEALLQEHAESRDILLRLAILHYQLYEEKEAREYFERARVLDPNGETVSSVEKLLKR